MMENQITTIAKNQEQASSIQRLTSTGLEKLKRLSEEVICRDGFNGLELIGAEELRDDDLLKAQIQLETNFGTSYGAEKIIQLYRNLKASGWTRQRFWFVFDWFLKNKHYAAWTIADWYDYGVKLYPVRWSFGKIALGYSGNDFDYYQIGNDVLCKLKDGIELPLPSPEKKQPLSAYYECYECGEKNIEVKHGQEFWQVHKCKQRPIPKEN